MTVTVPLELDLDDDEDGFLVAYIPDLAPSRHSCYEGGFGRLEEEDDDEYWGFGCGRWSRRVVNSFAELEPAFVHDLQEATGKKVWTVGPLSLCNKKALDMAERGDKASIDIARCLKWLDSMDPGSVVYASFGSVARLAKPQLTEIGLGLEASGHPFIWVLKIPGEKASREVERWLEEEGFEERNRTKGLLIWGWAPQLLILSHAAVGGFVTHCGWNSTLEGVCAGVPMVSWPLFGEQFLNEKLMR